MFNLENGLYLFEELSYSSSLPYALDKRILKPELEMKRANAVEQLTNGKGEYIGSYRVGDCHGFTYKNVIEFDNNVYATMTDNALFSKENRVKKNNNYYRSIPEDFTYRVLRKVLKSEDAVILREVSLEGLRVSLKFDDFKFDGDSSEARLINSFKRAINDFFIKIGDKTLILSVASIGHHAKYDNDLNRINKCFYLNQHLGFNFIKIDVPFIGDKINFERYLNRLNEAISSVFGLENISTELTAGDIYEIKLQLVNDYTNNIASKLGL